ncbi:Response regulator receiver modulated diguanylate cyclase [Planktothrix serta PCC 8927]|uniref:Response regulator receiver modulated diguanylate cyclase n=1 Tax=Planktothrix serta PCC 8927 TaxID=671068 RepID=A0A7Z9E1Q6_9CYAN|nr:response regulator [Planktothrix serta]VXD23084.1 Response regulator receiver modulated diguanylate cyclase [Planktothrix serta PCC 8927]
MITEENLIDRRRNDPVKILCVEDDHNLAKLLKVTLVKHHYQVDIATDGLMGWNFAETFSYDLILLDLILPQLDGLQFCQQLRSNSCSPLTPNSDTPVLLMTALDTVTNKVIGLDAGADDYIIKPFDLDEFLARIRALLRRHQGIRTPLLTWGKLCMNPKSCEVTYQNKPIILTAKEYELLEIFLRNPQQIFSVNRLLDCLWKSDEFPSEGTVRAHIKGLRKKLKEQGAEDIIETIYKLGYRLRSETGIETVQKTKSHTPTPEQRLESSRVLPQIVTPFSLSSEMLPELWPVWQESQQTYSDRISLIQQAIAALRQGTLTPEQQHQAERETHTLIGSLGCFGLMSASDLSRQIQQVLKSEKPLKLSDAEQLQTLTTALQNTIDQVTQQVNPKTDPQPPTLKRSRLLVVDDDFPLAKIIALEATTWGYESHIATDLHQAEQLLKQYDIDGIVLDLNFPNSTETGLDFLAKVRCEYPQISVVMLTAEETLMKRVEAARLGSPCFLQKPITPHQVLVAVSQVLEQKNTLPTRILVVDDNQMLLEALESVLDSAGYHVTLLSQPQHFWETLEHTTPDLLILDLELSTTCSLPNTRESNPLPGVTGWDLCQIIRRDPRWNRLPIVVLSGYTDVETVQRSFAAGADDVLSKPLGPKELLTRISSRLQQCQRWEMTELDELTGVSLRRKALQDLTSLLHLAQRQQQSFSLAILDLDHFKRINDQYGHDIGDQVLNHLGKLLRQSLRPEDVVGRWGGEEFVMGMYGLTKTTAIKRLQEILNELSQYQFKAKNGTPFQVTFSGGVAQFPDDGNDIQTLYQSADTALYQAKAQGRSRIISHQS